jgi:hypothetical protein
VNKLPSTGDDTYSCYDFVSIAIFGRTLTVSADGELKVDHFFNNAETGFWLNS